MSADYLFQTDKCYDVCYDTGDKVIQCGRHNDIFKLWLQWRARVSQSDLFFRVSGGGIGKNFFFGIFILISKKQKKEI